MAQSYPKRSPGVPLSADNALSGYARVVDEAGIELAAAQVVGRFGRQPQAIVPVHQPGLGASFVCAVPRSDGLDWVVVDATGSPLDDRARIRGVVEIAAICEAAEESAAALAVDEALPALAEAWRLAGSLGEAGAELATHAAYQAVETLQPLVTGLRVADPTYLDRLADAAALLGDRFELLKEEAGQVSARLTGQGSDPLEQLAQSLWAAIRILSRDGSPDRFRQAVEGAMGPAAAFADDVLEHYLVPLAGGDDVEELR